VSPVKYELGFYIPEDDIVHTLLALSALFSSRVLIPIYVRVGSTNRASVAAMTDVTGRR
jgi:hypothetical protein